MPSSDRPTALDLETLKTKISLRAWITIIGAIVVATAWAVTTYAGVATKSEVIEALKEHGEDTHADTDGRLGILEAKDAQQDSDIAVLKEQGENIKVINARIEFLTQNAIMEAQQEGAGATRRVKRAASKARKSAEAKGMEDDPLGGLEGL